MDNQNNNNSQKRGSVLITQDALIPDVVKQRHMGEGNRFIRSGTDTGKPTTGESTSGNSTAVYYAYDTNKFYGWNPSSKSWNSAIQALASGAVVYSSLASSAKAQIIRKAGTSGDSTASTSYGDIASGSTTITIPSGQTATILLIAKADCDASANTVACYLRTAWDTGGTPAYSIDNITGIPTIGIYNPIIAFQLVTGVTAGTYTFSMQKKVNSGTGYYYNCEVYAVAIPQ